MIEPTHGRALARAAVAGLVLPAVHAATFIDIEPMVVSALRFPQAESSVTSAVTVLDPQELENEGILQIRDALNASPGVISTSTAGETGAVGSLFIRGTTTAYSQVVVDGMRLSDSTTQLGNFLGASRTYDVGSIEILRGAQGAIYGGESVGGVLWMETPRGSGKPSGSTSIEAGSFESWSARGMFQGETGRMNYYLSGGFENTNNDGPAQAFHQGNTALRVEAKPDDVWTLGTTFRSIDSFYENSGLSDDHLDAALATVYASARVSDRWTARFLAGYHQEFYDSDSSFGNYGTDLRDGSISTDHEVLLAENLRLLAGAYAHRSSFENTIGTDVSQDRYGFHTALEWDVLDNLTTTGAVRWEDYDAYGDEATWRLGVVYHVAATGTRLRGGVGTSFRSPTYLDLYGSSFGAGNPNLDAESALGWDVGIEQTIRGSHVAEVTWFHNRIEDQIQTTPAPPVNIPGDTTTDGIEFGMRGSFLTDAVTYRVAWTWLHESLSDQPRNAATASLAWKPVDKALVGIGATHLADHSWGGTEIGAYTVARLFGSYQISDRVKLNARIENVFDEDYELSNFYGTVIEGAGTGLYAGVTIDW